MLLISFKVAYAIPQEWNPVSDPLQCPAFHILVNGLPFRSKNKISFGFDVYFP